MRIIIPSDLFPPAGKGGAAWSSHALARALLARGHSVTAVVPQRGGSGRSSFDANGVPALRVCYPAPPVPIVQNYFRHERLWRPLAEAIVAVARAGPLPDAIHAQHVQSAPAAVLAGRQLGVPVLVTVRDHWPWHYWATGLHGDKVPYKRPGWPGVLTELPARLGSLQGILALPALPYLLVHLRRRAAYLAQADAVIACSSYIAERLAEIVPAERLHVLPHMVDIAANDTIAAAPPQMVWQGALLLYAGKLERNKGAGLLPAIFRALRERASGGGDNSLAPWGLPPFTLVVAGDGALRDWLEHELAALGVPTRFLAWAGHEETLRLLARCDLLLFPSVWGEPLSRVLLEAASFGAPILAMPTGGTPDIVADGESGALASTPEQFAARLAALLLNPSERRRLGAGARALAQARFAVPVLAPRYEALYASLRG